MSVEDKKWNIDQNGRRKERNANMVEIGNVVKYKIKTRLPKMT